MKVSLNWLQDYVVVDMKTSDLAYALTMAGLEVDAVYDRYEYLETVIVSRIVDICKHPNADRLHLCNIDIGDRIVEVVCGASNIKKDMIVPLAFPGTILPNGSVIEKTAIRGKTSEGMLCSEMELGLGTGKKGIMILSDSLTPGEKLTGALLLSDTIIEIDLTPNRPDCLSIIGVAREIAAFNNQKVTFPKSLPYEHDSFESGENRFNLNSVVIENHDDCPRYIARIIEDVVIAPAPFWLQDRLVSAGIKPVNNIVDITNYVMIETGQPLHAFDFEKLNGRKVVVRRFKEGETFTALDNNKKRKLSSDMLMICDQKAPVAIAGIMGGLNSEITTTTTRVLLESAYFDPVSIRKTSKKLGLSTESSHRFERGVDPEGVINASNRAAMLIEEIGCGKIANEIVDVHCSPAKRMPILLSTHNTNRLLGINLDQNRIEHILKSIEFTVKKIDSDKLSVLAPSFRVDIKQPADLIEEVARIYGYDKIHVTFPLIPAKCSKTLNQLNDRNRIKEIMTGCGFYETITYSFINKQSCDMLGLKPEDKKRNQVNIINPLVKDHGVMRSSLIPGLLETMRRNLSHQIKNLKIFETGKIFINTRPEHLPEEIEMMAGLQTGLRNAASWNIQEEACDFYDIKGVVEELFYALNISRLNKSPIRFAMMPNDLCTYTKPGSTAEIFADDTYLGLVGQVSYNTVNNFDLMQPVFIFELNLDRIYPLIPDCVFSEPLPKFPFVSRDITMIIDKHIESALVLRKVKALKVKWVEDVFLFDTFEGEPIHSDKKSISLRIKYRSANKTLEDHIVNDIHKKITDKLIDQFEADLP